MVVDKDMIGHPKHVNKALDAGVDIICAQGGEGGGHTGAYLTKIRCLTFQCSHIYSYSRSRCSLSRQEILIERPTHLRRRSRWNL